LAGYAGIRPDLAVQKYLSVPFSLRCTYLTVQIFGTAEPYLYWQEASSENFVAHAYAKGDLWVDIDLITYAIASGGWRILSAKPSPCWTTS
jgi:hypothetical protein